MTLQSVSICVSEYRFMQLLLFLSQPTACVRSLAGEPTHETEKGFRSEPVQNAGPTSRPAGVHALLGTDSLTLENFS
jgi:hypothetical protein